MNDSAASDDPVSLWIDQLRASDEAAARKLWHHFIDRLQKSARRKLRSVTRRVYDEEDAALSAFQSVCAGIAGGRFPDLNDRNGLWQLLLVITSRKVSARHRYDKRERRDVRRNLYDTVFTDSRTEIETAGTDKAAAPEPTPEYTAELVETFEMLFDHLDDPTLREIACLRMEGYTEAEVAARLSSSRRTIQRRIEIIRRRWQRLEIGGETQ